MWDNARGRDARGVQAVAPGRRVSTEEPKTKTEVRSISSPDISPGYPPATTSACTALTCGLVQSHPCGKSSTGVHISLLRQLGELLHKAVDVVPAINLCWYRAQTEMDQNQGRFLGSFPHLLFECKQIYISIFMAV